MEEVEQYFPCPHCGETISMLLDLTAGDQRYVEDCEVCCRPIEINFTVDEHGLLSWDAHAES